MEGRSGGRGKSAEREKCWPAHTRRNSRRGSSATDGTYFSICVGCHDYRQRSHSSGFSSGVSAAAAVVVVAAVAVNTTYRILVHSPDTRRRRRLRRLLFRVQIGTLRSVVLIR